MCAIKSLNEIFILCHTITFIENTQINAFDSGAEIRFDEAMIAIGIRTLFMILIVR